jgi:hypothetical protein
MYLLQNTVGGAFAGLPLNGFKCKGDKLREGLEGGKRDETFFCAL